MSRFDFDLFVIGAGSGGVRAARVAAAHGAKVGIAEEHRVGGTCVIRGCVPKKLLFYGANFAEDLVDARRFGWDVGTPRFDWTTLRDNVLADVDRLNRAYTDTLEHHQVEIRHSHARLIDAHTIDVGGEPVTAKHVLIAAGARPTLPNIPGIELAITSNEVFHLEALPKSIAIVGTGYIANEFAGIMHELGVDVTLVARGNSILRGWDHSLRERLLAISLTKGLKFRFNALVQRIDKTSGGISLHFAEGEQLEAEMVMIAVGRTPNTEGLDVGAAGVELAPDGSVKVDETLRTSAEGVYAVGDVINRVQLTPVAIREGQALADHLFAGKPVELDYGCVASAVFSHPPLASVGLTESEARNRLGPVAVYTSDFRPMKNVLAGRSERALIKMIVDEADRIVGAHMIGPEAPEIMQLIAVAVKAKLTKTQFDQTVAIHPTMAEEWVLMRR
ncbi:MAG: glutathione-disulfide reductase [Sphingomonadaceae bacterium]|nr:glutathione-disulfide reductase [Sphingomonadaceae bacterium]